MSPEVIGTIGLVILVILLFSRMWIGATMLLVGFLGCILLGGFKSAATLIGMVPYSESASYTMACLPLFVMMGLIISVTGLGGDLYKAASNWIGHMKGGLAIATTLACGVFAAVCGDSMTSAVTMSKVAFPEMKKYKYDDGLAASCITAGGTIGILIPPSVGFIIYGLITEQSIGKLFIAGVIPGILQVVFYIVTISVLCHINPKLSTTAPKVNMKERVSSLKTVWPVLVIFIVIVVGIYGGIVTPTEAASLGAFTALVVGLVLKRLSKDKLLYAVNEAVQTTAMIFFLVIGAHVFTRFMAYSHLPASIGEGVIGLNTIYHVPRFAIMAGIILMYILLGCIMDVMAAIFLTLPIIYPVIIGLGYDPIWFGVIMVRVMEIGMITPPFGLNLFIVTRTSGVPIKTLYKGIMPFITADIIHVILLLIIPELSLFLPGLM